MTRSLGYSCGHRVRGARLSISASKVLVVHIGATPVRGALPANTLRVLSEGHAVRFDESLSRSSGRARLQISFLGSESYLLYGVLCIVDWHFWAHTARAWDVHSGSRNRDSVAFRTSRGSLLNHTGDSFCRADVTL